MTREDAAVDAVCARVAELAPGADPKELKTLAEAVAEVRFGPQGGSLTNHTSTHYDYQADILNRYPARNGAPEVGFGDR